jgi:hypothetical protein
LVLDNDVADVDTEFLRFAKEVVNAGDSMSAVSNPKPFLTSPPTSTDDVVVSTADVANKICAYNDSFCDFVAFIVIGLVGLGGGGGGGGPL